VRTGAQVERNKDTRKSAKIIDPGSMTFQGIKNNNIFDFSSKEWETKFSEIINLMQ